MGGFLRVLSPDAPAQSAQASRPDTVSTVTSSSPDQGGISGLSLLNFVFKYPRRSLCIESVGYLICRISRKNALAHGVMHELRRGWVPELAPQARAVRLDRAHAQHQHFGDLGVRAASRDEPKHL